MLKTAFFNGNIQSYRYLLTKGFIQVVIPIKVAIPSRKRKTSTKDSYTFEKTETKTV